MSATFTACLSNFLYIYISWIINEISSSRNECLIICEAGENVLPRYTYCCLFAQWISFAHRWAFSSAYALLLNYCLNFCGFWNISRWRPDAKYNFSSPYISFLFAHFLSLVNFAFILLIYFSLSSCLSLFFSPLALSF